MTAAGSGRGMREVLGAAAIALAAACAYVPALGGGFVWDDHWFLEESPALTGPLWRVWTGAGAPDYWPLSVSSFWLEWRIWGPWPAGYHLVNLALHVATALLLWRVLRALRVRGAWLAALVFAVHPVAVESVAWISERKNVLSGALAAGAVLAWLRADEGGPRRPRALALSLALYALALLAKTSVVMIAPLLLALAWARRGRVTRDDVRGAAPFFAAALAAGLATLWFQWREAMALLYLPPRGPLERLGGAAWAFASYVEKAYLPARLALAYPPWPLPAASPWFYLPLAASALAAGLAWRLRAGPLRPLILALGYQLLVVLPVLGLVDIAFFDVAPVSNHLQYLALAGPAALAGHVLAGVSRRWPGPAGRAPAAALALALGAITFHRASAFADDLTLWQRAVADAPGSAYARTKLAVALAEAGRRDEALAELEQLSRSATDPALRHHARSFWLLFQGRVDEALPEAEEAARLRPTRELRRHLGLQLTVGGRWARALEVLAPLAAEAPEDPDYQYWLGAALAGAGRGAEAEARLREVLRLSPGHGAAREALARVLAAQGRIPEARGVLAEGLGLPASDPRVEAALRAVAGRPPR